MPNEHRYNIKYEFVGKGDLDSMPEEHKSTEEEKPVEEAEL